MEKLTADNHTLEKLRVRRVELGDNLVFMFDSKAPRKGDLACTLLVEGEIPDLHARWMEISRHIYVRCAANSVVRANQISASVLNGTTSPVQRLVFDTEGDVPISIGCDDQ